MSRRETDFYCGKNLIVSKGVKNLLRLIEVLGVIEGVSYGKDLDPSGLCGGYSGTGVLEHNGEIRCLLQTEQLEGLEIRIRGRFVVPDGIRSDDDIEKMLNLISSQDRGYFFRMCGADKPDPISSS